MGRFVIVQYYKINRLHSWHFNNWQEAAEFLEILNLIPKPQCSKSVYWLVIDNELKEVTRYNYGKI